MRKKLLIFLSIFVLSAMPAFASSLLYTFSSGDILAANSNATYGIGRIDFTGEKGITPRVLLSGDRRELALGEFTRNGKKYIYASKVNKANENTTYFDIYDPSRGVSSNDTLTPINASELILTVQPNSIASADLTLAPNAEGYVYAIDGTTLKRYDFLNWGSPTTTTLKSDYNVYSLVALTNNNNFLYVWGSNRSAVSADGSYTPVSSDIFIYDRSSLAQLAHFPFVRTGLDATKKLADDAPYEPEVGRGLVDISNTSYDKSVVLVVYENASSDTAQIIRP